MLSDQLIINKIGIRKSDKILDIGGSMKQHDIINIHTLVDLISPEEAPYIRSKLLAKNFVRLDLTKEKLPFKDNEFDVCICSHTLEDLHNPFLAIEEMQRVAKRGIIVTPSMGIDMVFSHIDITDWLVGPRRTPGHSHHKWFFLNEKNKMIIIPKNYGVLYSGRFQITNWSGERDFVYKWNGKINYEVFQELNVHDLINYYEKFTVKFSKFIKYGRVLSFFDSPFYVLKAYLKFFARRGEGFKKRINK